MRPKRGISGAEQEYAVAKSGDRHFETEVALLVVITLAVALSNHWPGKIMDAKPAGLSHRPRSSMIEKW
jgi:hypothetical protein